MAMAGRHTAPRDVLTAGNLMLRLSERRVAVGGQPVHLTYLEFELLTVLIRNLNRVVRYRRMGRTLWPEADQDLRNRIRVMVRRLRVKLRELEPYRIEAVQRVGYRFAVPDVPNGSPS